MKSFLYACGTIVLAGTPSCSHHSAQESVPPQATTQPVANIATQPAVAITTPTVPATQVSIPIVPVAPKPPETPEYANFNHGDTKPGDKSIEWIPAITVSSPPCCSDVNGNVTVNFNASGMTTVKASCWHQPTADNPNPWGHDVDFARDIPLDATGNGSFVFPADDFPNGPAIVRIYAKDTGKKQDVYQLQLYNQGGIHWNQGIPKSDPSAAAGMKLVFSDDFDGPLSISNNGNGATYSAHKTGGGDFSGWQFADVTGPLNPFSQVGTYLRIHASKTAKGQSSGILSSAHADGTGTYAGAPCYFECRFIAQSAPGTWPAFWLLNKGCLDKTTKAADEIDIIEAYGGLGKKNPNFPGYACTTHFWNQVDANGKKKNAGHADVPIMDLGGKSGWSSTFHTYACKITKTDTIYYFDDMEVFRHPSGDISKTDKFWFLINYAIGGISGWHIDLARYSNVSDMYVDYVRVYEGN